MGWEDQGRQGHGWFGNGTSGVVADSAARREAEVARAAVGVAVARLPRRVRAEFEAFAARDGGARMLRAMAVWTDAAGMDAASFRRVTVGSVVSRDAAAAFQAMGRVLAESSKPGAAQAAGEHLAAALNGLRPGSLRYDLRSAQDQAVHAAATGQVPDRPPPLPPCVPVLTSVGTDDQRRRAECLALCSSHLEKPLSYPWSDKNTNDFHRCVNRCMGGQ